MNLSFFFKFLNIESYLSLKDLMWSFQTVIDWLLTVGKQSLVSKRIRLTQVSNEKLYSDNLVLMVYDWKQIIQLPNVIV